MSEPDRRPVIVGMNNPYGSSPEYALFPAPEHSAGGRLYAMVSAAHARRTGDTLSRRGYLDGFDRRNVLSTVRWSPPQARLEGALLARALAGRRVVVLGRQTAQALGLPRTDWLERRGAQSPGALAEGLPELTFWTVPHPSGMCREYNDPEMVRRVGDLLYALLSGSEP